MSEKRKEKQPNITQQLKAEKQRSEEYLTRLKYLQADFDNIKKRSARQIQEAKNYCTERLVVELLEVVDELELALTTAQSADCAKSLVEGVKMTLKKLQKLLAQEGVTYIASEGKIFDPLRHNAIATIERDDVDHSVVVEEVRKGYIMKDKVIRPSMVKVGVNNSKLQKEK